MKKPIDMITAYANFLYEKKKKIAKPNNFYWYYTARLPENDQPPEKFTLIGALAPVFKKGQRKGEINWDKIDRQTTVRVEFKTTALQAWIKKTYPNLLSA